MMYRVCFYLAYIGPGGGFAVGASLLALALTLLGILWIVMFWPFAFTLSSIRRRRVRYRHGYRKVVVLGLDGMDAAITARLLDKGKLPNLARLASSGSHSQLATVFPAITPAAWPSFMTGCDPTYHSIYDFIRPDAGTYKPVISSYETVAAPVHQGICFGLSGGACMRSLRKGRPFWDYLEYYGLEVTIQRLPITFPPDKVRGRLLSGMCVPDLLGTQGVCTLYTTRADQRPIRGEVVEIKIDNNVAYTHLYGPAAHNAPGPTRPSIPLKLSFENAAPNTVRLSVGPNELVLRLDEQSEWVPVHFKASSGPLRGQVRFTLIRADHETSIYMTPIHIAADRPSTPISSPWAYAGYLARGMGSFGTLGLMEDTDALSDGVISEDCFLDQVWDFFEERKAMFFHALKLHAEDVTVCVFDTPDRIQHMFWRYTEPAHPANPDAEPSEYAQQIDQTYIRMDQLVGETMERLPSDTLLLVVSDHGFTSFRRGINLNTWLIKNGYMKLLPGREACGLWLEGVDWSQTKAYAVGLAGIHINRTDRESRGIVKPGVECRELAEGIRQSLQQLEDSAKGAAHDRPIRRVAVTASDFSGPYRSDGPDLLIGYGAGYRCSWESAMGQSASEIFTDNDRAWSGDHCVDPEVVPGIIFSNAVIRGPGARLIDIAPTILDVFGIESRNEMQGRSLFPDHAGR